MLERAGIEGGERHEILGVKGVLAVIEVPLAVLYGRIDFLLLEHLARL